MPVSKEQVAKIIGGKARELCSPEGDRMISEAHSSRNGNGYDPNPNDYDDYEQFDRMYLNEDEDVDTADIRYTRQNANFSKLPDNIKESLINNPIDRSSLSNVSVLDSMNVVPKKKQQRQKQRVNEEIYNQSYQPSQNGIDYSLIKAIVNECITEYFEKRPLNESTLKTIGLKKGKITLVNSNGDTFVANLEKIGNINKNGAN